MQSVDFRRFLLLGCVLAFYSFSGCDSFGVKVDPSQFSQALMRIDSMTMAVDKVVNEAGLWRTGLPDLAKAIRDNGQDVLANEVENIATRFAADLANVPKETLDYLEIKIKDNLKDMRKSLTIARQKIVDAQSKNDLTGVSQALDELVKSKVFHDPVATTFIPNHVQIVWNEFEQNTYTVRVPRIEVRGWGFERPDQESPRFSVTIENKDQPESSIPMHALSLTSRYLMQISLAADGVAFRPGDRKLLFKTGLGKPQELPIEHIIPAPKAPEMPPSKLVKVEIKKLTILDCADDDEDVKMSISVSGLNGSAEIPYKNDSRPDEYVYPFSREGGFRSIFFVALQTDVFEAEKVKITVHIETLDGDGAHWGGDHVHIKEVAKLPLGTNEFREDRNKSLSPFPASPYPYKKFGNYELLYSISRIENAK